MKKFFMRLHKISLMQTLNRLFKLRLNLELVHVYILVVL